MANDDLFSDLPVQTNSEVFEPGRPRLRQPVRDQIELREGEFSNVTRSYAGKGIVRYTW